MLGVSQGSVGAACQVRRFVTFECPGALERTPTYTKNNASQLPTCRAAMEFDGLGVSAIVLHAGGGEAELFSVGGGEAEEDAVS